MTQPFRRSRYSIYSITVHGGGVVEGPITNNTDGGRQSIEYEGYQLLKSCTLEQYSLSAPRGCLRTGW